MPLLILLELDEAAPMKTITTLHGLPGVLDIHMNLDLTPAELRRLLREGPREAKPTKRGGTSIRALLLGYLAQHPYGSYRDLGQLILNNGGAAGSAGATLNKLKGDGEVKNDSHGWSLTGQGRKAAAALLGTPVGKSKANGDGRRAKTRGGFGNEEVLTMLRRAGGKKTLDQIAAAFEQHGKTRNNARQTLERLKMKKLVTTTEKEGERIVVLREKANATA